MIGILVVDDNMQMRETLRTILDQQPGFHVIGEAADGISATQLAQTLRPTVVLMDIGMGRMDGIEDIPEKLFAVITEQLHHRERIPSGSA